MSWSSQLRAWLGRRFSPAKSLGERGEDAAARFLKRQGYTILERGHKSRLGELDIIAVDDRTIVFVEVKTRTSDDAGRPTEAIDERKQRRMTQAALGYLKAKRILETAARFDIVAITWPEGTREPSIEHYKNAFAAIGSRQFFS